MVVMALLVVAAVVIARLAQRILMMIVGLVVVGGLLVAIWVQRDELAQCQETCACSLFGQDIQVPDARLCGEDSLLGG